MSFDASVKLGKPYDLTQKTKFPFTAGMQSLNHVGLFLEESKAACSGRACPAAWAGIRPREKKPLKETLMYFSGLVCHHEQQKLSPPFSSLFPIYFPLTSWFQGFISFLPHLNVEKPPVVQRRLIGEAPPACRKPSAPLSLFIKPERGTGC